MGKGSDLGVGEVDNRSDENLPTYTWEEIKSDKSWIVIDDFVYDVTNFSKKHPGGPIIIKNHIGQDASV
jgi:cytochrome b involved in lipid metabolism